MPHEIQQAELIFDCNIHQKIQNLGRNVCARVYVAAAYHLNLNHVEGNKLLSAQGSWQIYVFSPIQLPSDYLLEHR